MDEVVITIRGKKHWLWRAIDANGDVLDILVQARRNAKAARRFFKRLVVQFGEPRVVITDKLRSYIKPVRTLAPQADHRAHKGLNNAIEVSHRPTRKREKVFGRFKSQRQAQRFLSTHDQISAPADINLPQSHTAMPELMPSVCGAPTPPKWPPEQRRPPTCGTRRTTWQYPANSSVSSNRPTRPSSEVVKLSFPTVASPTPRLSSACLDQWVIAKKSVTGWGAAGQSRPPLGTYQDRL